MYSPVAASTETYGPHYGLSFVFHDLPYIQYDLEELRFGSLGPRPIAEQVGEL